MADPSLPPNKTLRSFCRATTTGRLVVTTLRDAAGTRGPKVKVLLGSGFRVFRFLALNPKPETPKGVASNPGAMPSRPGFRARRPVGRLGFRV